VTTQVHNFTQSLALSHEYEDAEWWGRVYQRAFSNFSCMTSTRQDGWAQRGGIDRVITLKSGKTVTVDEKVRLKDYDDVLLERWSDVDRKTPGWVQKDLACDYIAYAFLPSRRCYLFPFLELRRAWKTFGKTWAEVYRPVYAKNESCGRRWVTESVPVPLVELQNALTQTSLIRWEEYA
jgi:hypothetical protein